MSQSQPESRAPSASPDVTKSAKADYYFVSKFAISMLAHIEAFTDAQLRAIICAYGLRSWR